MFPKLAPPDWIVTGRGVFLPSHWVLWRLDAILITAELDGVFDCLTPWNPSFFTSWEDAVAHRRARAQWFDAGIQDGSATYTIAISSGSHEEKRPSSSLRCCRIRRHVAAVNSGGVEAPRSELLAHYGC